MDFYSVAPKFMAGLTLADVQRQYRKRHVDQNKVVAFC